MVGFEVAMTALKGSDCTGNWTPEGVSGLSGRGEETGGQYIMSGPLDPTIPFVL